MPDGYEAPWATWTTAGEEMASSSSSSSVSALFDYCEMAFQEGRPYCAMDRPLPPQVHASSHAGAVNV